MNLSNKLLSDITAFRTYAKYLSHLGRRESLSETINRNMLMHLERFPNLSKDIIKAFQKIHELKVMPSMRGLQFAGDAVHKNMCRQYNCSFIHLSDVAAFSEALFLLLSGTGVGYSVQSHHIRQLPKIKQPIEEGEFVVHDSIQGWAQALNILLEAYFYNRIRPQFNLTRIRPKGSYLVTTGAKAPGPEPLRVMLQDVEARLKKAIGRQLTTLEVHDIICIISESVLSGGVRRSACIALFDHDDNDMLTCKQGDWWVKNPQRARANNTAVLLRSTVTKEQFENVFNMCIASKAGEPGIKFTNSLELGVNPCVVGDTNILTKNGYKRIDSLVDTEVEIWNGFEWSIVTPKVTGENQPIIEVITKLNRVLRCTDYHKFYIRYPGSDKCFFIEAKELSISDQLKKWTSPNGEEIEDEVVGLKRLPNADKVYCFNEPKRHLGVFNGILTGQCGEISLNSNQFCNLSTINQSYIQDKKDFLNRVYAAALIGTLQASYTDFPFLRPKWKEQTELESLLGVSFTGIADGMNQIGPDELQTAAKLVMEVNQKYAKKISINPAARTTAIKPEGTTSCVLGSSSGIHARHAPHYLRRIRMNKDDALAQYLRYSIPNLVEDDVFSATGIVVTIPQESPAHSITRDSEGAIDVLERVIMYHKNWIVPGHRSGLNNNNVSVTINYKPEEVDELRERLWNERNNYTAISLLPFDGGTYKQAPFETCTEDTYKQMMEYVKDIDLKNVQEGEDKTERVEAIACVGGVCSIE